MILILRSLALLGLLLLPVELRAGAMSLHPHALLHLLLDARDGSFDHHHAEDPATTAAHHDVQSVHVAESHSPDIPAYATFVTPTGGLAVLAVVVTALAIPAPRARRTWPPLACWRDRLPVLEPPPPRIGCV